MNIEYEIYEGKSLSDLFKDIINNSEGNKKNITKLVRLLSGFIKDRNDAVVLLPAIKEFLEVDVKNDEQLVKVAGIVQRLATNEKAASDGLISNSERDILLAQIKNESKELQRSSENVTTEVDTLTANIN